MFQAQQTTWNIFRDQEETLWCGRIMTKVTWGKFRDINGTDDESFQKPYEGIGDKVL